MCYSCLHGMALCFNKLITILNFLNLNMEKKYGLMFVHINKSSLGSSIILKTEKGS